MTAKELLTEIRKGEKSKLANSPALTIDIAPIQRLRLELEVAIYGGESHTFNIRYENATERLFVGEFVISVKVSIVTFQGETLVSFSAVIHSESGDFVCECEIDDYRSILNHLE